MCWRRKPDKKPDPKKLFSADPNNYGPEYLAHLLEQYKVFVDSADKNSDRRQSANNYFIAINTALITILGFSFQISTSETKSVVWFFLGVAGVIASILFWFLINAYKQLGTGKFAVIHEIEKRLPLAMFKYEWTVLGGGKKVTKYFPFSHIERVIPIFSAIGYGLLVFLAMHYGALNSIWQIVSGRISPN